MSPPSNEELMMYADGELDPSRAAEVRAFLAENEDARDIVAGLKLAGNLIAEDALDGAADLGDVADLVMRRIESEPRRGVVRSLGTRVMAGVGLTIALAAGFALFLRGTKTAPSDLGSYVPRADDAATEMAEVDEIDFGARAGTIFYVPSGGKSTTTVVWLMDDEESGGSGEKL
jgi:anti-sigma factor RsiW